MMTRTGTGAAQRFKHDRVHIAVTIDGKMRGVLVRQTMPELSKMVAVNGDLVLIVLAQDDDLEGRSDRERKAWKEM